MICTCVAVNEHVQVVSYCSVTSGNYAYLVMLVYQLFKSDAIAIVLPCHVYEWHKVLCR